MKDVKLLPEAREGKEAFNAIDLRTYTQRVFSMFSGEKRRVTIRFINPLLDTVIDRFGTKEVSYMKDDDRHFTVSADVEVSNQFFSWIVQFGNKAKIVYPVDVAEEMKKFLEKILVRYE